jgi:hypothetical protein
MTQLQTSPFVLPDPPLLERACPLCGEKTPTDAFRIRQEENGQRQLLCPTCWEERPAIRALEKQQAEKADAFRQMVARVRDTRLDDVSDLVGALLSEFKDENEEAGVKQFAHEWVEELRQGAGTPRGQATRLAGFAAIAKMIVASTAYQAQLPEASKLSDEELAEHMRVGVMQALRDNPELAAETLATMPPADQVKILQNVSPQEMQKLLEYSQPTDYGPDDEPV